MEFKIERKLLFYSVMIASLLFMFVKDGNCETNNIIMSPLGVYKQTYVSWKQTLKDQKLNGTTFIGVIPGNGIKDTMHAGGARDTIIFAPSSIDYSKPVEIIFFFHGLRGFGEHDFNIRIASNIKQLVKEKNNFIIIFPEMPWSKNTKTPTKRQKKAWSGKEENFGIFYKASMMVLYTQYSEEIFNHTNTLTIIGHSAGGGAIKQAALSKVFDFINPDRIVFSDADYVDYTKTTWEEYLKYNPNCELVLYVRKGDKPHRITKKFLKRFGKDIPKNIKFKSFPRRLFTHKQIGDVCLKELYTNEADNH